MSLPASIKVTVIGLIVLGSGCFSFSPAATLAEYSARLSDALNAIQRLQTRNEDPTQRAELATTAVALQIKAELPVQEQILMTGQTITVDNRWLQEALDDYLKQKSQAAQNARLKAIGERLRAILERVNELKQSPTVAGKDESKARLAEILRRPEYNQKPAEGSALNRLWETFIRWLISLFPRTKPLQPGSAQMLSRVAQIVVVAISLGAIALLIWKFGPRYFRSRSKKKKKREARIILGERLEPDQTASDLLAQAEALARAGDLRGAIRKGYIALLCELGDRKLISLAQHKTNRDYLRAVRDQPTLFETMRHLTNSFEVHWYGLVPARDTDWTAFRRSYQRALTAPLQR